MSRRGKLFFVYRHQDDPSQLAYVEKGATTIKLWLWGFELKPVYALRIRER